MSKDAKRKNTFSESNKKSSIINIKNSLKQNVSHQITPTEAIQFLDSFQKMMAAKDEPTVPISIRIPKNILTALKIKAKNNNQKYQSLIVEYLRRGIKGEN
jgi:predicted DNA binding CopG/RHH family protein